MKIVNDINSALHDILREHQETFIIGEDLHDPYGGAFKITAGLSTKHPNRVISTPISESAITGIAVGAALRGMKPIVEIMFGDFLTLAMDQLVNHAAKFPGMFSGKVTVPLVVRTPMGGYRGYGPTHSQSLEKHFLGIPGLRVVAINHFISPGEILKKAVIEDPMPVLFIENKLLYSMNVHEYHSNISAEALYNKEDIYPIINIKNYPEDNLPDTLLVSYGGMSRLIEDALEQCRKEEIWINAALPINISNVTGIVEWIADSKIQNLILVEEGAGGYGYSSEICSKLLSSGVHLNTKVITAHNSVIPSSAEMEKEMLPSTNLIIENILELLE